MMWCMVRESADATNEAADVAGSKAHAAKDSASAAADVAGTKAAEGKETASGTASGNLMFWIVGCVLSGVCVCVE